MMEVEIDFDAFWEDVKDGMSAYNLQDKYLLTPRQYRKIMRDFERKKFARKRSRTKPYSRRSYFNEPYISMKKDGHYIIKKGTTYFGQYDSLEIARKVKKGLLECNWDKTQLNPIRLRLGLKKLRGL